MWRCLRAHLLAMALLGSSALHAAPLLQLRVEAGEHQATVRRIAVSADGALVATASDDKTARLWRAADRRLLATLRVPIGDGDQGRLYGVTFSPDGRQLAVAGTNGDPATPHRIDVFDAGNARHLRTLQLDAGHVVRLLWTRDGRHLAACLSGRDGLRIMTADSGQTVYSEAFAAPCFGLAELPDGSLLASGFDGQIRQLRSQGGRWQAVASLRTEIADPQAIAVAPDGLHFAVGYRSRLPSGDIAIDVFDAGKLTLARRFSFGGLRGGSLGSVAWSGDGRTLAASGRAGADGQIVLKRITWPQGSVASDIVATNTVQDMVPYGVDWFALASSNGSWALIPAAGAVSTLGGSVIDIRGADSLRADETLRALSFGAGGTQGALRFELPRRLLASGQGSGLDSARRVSFSLRVTQWENQFQPQIAGRAVTMEPLELSRAYALLPDSAGVMLGTSRTLRRVDSHGKPIWSQRVAGEVMSVTTSRDGRLVLSAQADGTLRWFRASDGLLLLSLFVSVDQRWVLWTEQGYYDASVGAESLLGWHVNRSDGVGVDFFSIGRFRDKYLRPDVIDQVLATLDPQRALVAADAKRSVRVQAEVVAPVMAPVTGPVIPPVQAPVLADPHRQLLPPVVSVLTERSVSSASKTLQLRFAIRASEPRAQTMLVRVNGRPVDLTELVMPLRQDGEANGSLTVVMPEGQAEVALLAQAGSLFSDPVFVSWNWRPPAPPPPVATTAPPKPAPAIAAGPAPRLFLVAVGVSDYARKAYALDLAAKDASDFAAVMAAQGGRLYASVESRLLTDRRATRAAVLDALAWLQASAGPRDTAMLFIAGHGVNDDNGQYFFMGHDADVDRLAATAISESQLRGSLAAIKGKALLFADTCHAGNVIGSGAAVSQELGRLSNTLTSAENGVIVFSASTGRQESIEKKNWGNGAFTKALIEGLRGAADFRKEGVVTHQGLSYFLGQEVRKLTGNLQTPVTAVPVGVVDYPMVALVAAR
ncbi:MAG: caspase family protein [Rubrivivax sp.]|nr:caspase family protein [Rubrivivax sp.]